MSGAPSPHPAPHAERLSTARGFCILFGGPIAWFTQLCGAVALVGWPCFPTTNRFPEAVAPFGWTYGAAMILSLACLAVALASGIAAFAVFRQVHDEKEGDKAALIEVGHGRSRFTALWGVMLGFSFAVAILLTGVPFAMVRQCAG